MSDKVNVCQLTKTELRTRLTFAPAWIRKMPVQAQRRWLVLKYPKHYVAGPTVKGAIAGHKENRGIWSEKDLATFEVIMKMKVRRNTSSIDWERVIPTLIQEYVSS